MALTPKYGTVRSPCVDVDGHALDGAELQADMRVKNRQNRRQIDGLVLLSAIRIRCAVPLNGIA